MKKSVLLILLVTIIFSCSKENAQESETLQADLITEQNKAPEYPEPEIMDEFNSGCVANIIFLAEGFRESEMAEFKALADIAKQSILDMEPFSSVTNHLNFYRVDSPSHESGVSSIKFDNDCDSDPGDEEYVDTAWAVHSNRIGLTRYLGLKPEVRHYIDDLYGGYATGDFAYTVIIVNSTQYLGGAEFPGVTEHNDIENPRVSNMIISKYDSGDIFKFLVRHEFGHSFGDLADEYVDEDTYCAIHNFEHWFLPPVPRLNLRLSNPGGWFEGGRYVPTGIWRQWDNSIMNSDYYANEYAPIQQDIIKKRLSIAIECL